MPRLRFIRATGLQSSTIIFLFLIKAGAGLLIGWMSATYYPGNDYWGLNREGQVEYQLLLSDPARFVSSLFDSPYSHYHGFFDSVGSYWNDLKNNLIIKFIALLNILSRGNYYINSLFFNTISFLGMMALYRVYILVFPNRKIAVLLGCFFLPSTLYFSSGIYKDLVVFALLGFFCHLLFSLADQPSRPLRWVWLLLVWTGILLIRNYVAMILVPLSLAFWISNQYSLQAWKVYAGMLLFCLLATWLLPLMHPSANPLSVIVQKQKDFASLPLANTQIPLQALQPTPNAFLHNLPQALNHGFLRPYLWDQSGTFLLPMAIEIICLPLLFLLFLVFPNKNMNLHHPMVMFGLTLALILITLTGYIIPNLGSLIRYRSIYLPFLFTPLLAGINWNKIFRLKSY